MSSQSADTIPQSIPQVAKQRAAVAGEIEETKRLVAIIRDCLTSVAAPLPASLPSAKPNSDEFPPKLCALADELETRAYDLRAANFDLRNLIDSLQI